MLSLLHTPRVKGLATEGDKTVRAVRMLGMGWNMFFKMDDNLFTIPCSSSMATGLSGHHMRKLTFVIILLSLFSVASCNTATQADHFYGDS